MHCITRVVLITTINWHTRNGMKVKESESQQAGDMNKNYSVGLS